MTTLELTVSPSSVPLSGAEIAEVRRAVKDAGRIIPDPNLEITTRLTKPSLEAARPPSTSTERRRAAESADSDDLVTLALKHLGAERPGGTQSAYATQIARNELKYNIVVALLRQLWPYYFEPARVIWRKAFGVDPIETAPPPITIVHDAFGEGRGTGPTFDFAIQSGVDYTRTLMPSVIAEDRSAIESIQYVLGAVGAPTRVMSLAQVALTPPNPACSYVWIGADDNRFALELLNRLTPQTRFCFGQAQESQERYIRWWFGRDERDGVIVHSPLASYLLRGRGDSARHGWIPQFINTRARDFAVVARIRVGEQPTGAPLYHFFLSGIRGLGTWGAGWLFQHRYELIRDALNRTEELQLLLQVEYENGKITNVEDVSDKEQSYFDSCNDEFASGTEFASVFSEPARLSPRVWVDTLSKGTSSSLLANLSDRQAEQLNAESLAAADKSYETSISTMDAHSLNPQTPVTADNVSVEWKVEFPSNCTVDALADFRITIPIRRASPVNDLVGEGYVTIILSAPGFEVSPHFVSIPFSNLSEGGETVSAKFVLQARRPGRCAIEVQAFDRTERVGHLVLYTTVAAAAEDYDAAELNSDIVSEWNKVSVHKIPEILIT